MTAKQDLSAAGDTAGHPGLSDGTTYRDTLEKEIIRRIRIIESPGYKGVERFNRTDIFFAAGLAGLMAALILAGASI